MVQWWHLFAGDILLVYQIKERALGQCSILEMWRQIMFELKLEYVRCCFGIGVLTSKYICCKVAHKIAPTKWLFQVSRVNFLKSKVKELNTFRSLQQEP